MIIVDVDGVLSDDQWRLQFVRQGDPDPFRKYNLYHMLSSFDEPKNLQIINHHIPDEIVIFTAMSEEYRVLRAKWMSVHNIRYRAMFMRKEGDHRHSEIIKKEMLQECFDLYELTSHDITAAYDDRESVIQMYEAQGIKGHLTKIYHNDERGYTR